METLSLPAPVIPRCTRALERLRGVHDLPIMVESLLRFFWRAAGNFRHHRRTSHARGGKQVVKPQTVAVSLVVLMVVARPGRLSAADSTGPAEIRQIKQGQRSTFYCVNCQK